MEAYYKPITYDIEDIIKENKSLKRRLDYLYILQKNLENTFQETIKKVDFLLEKICKLEEIAKAMEFYQIPNLF